LVDFTIKFDLNINGEPVSLNIAQKEEDKETSVVSSINNNKNRKPKSNQQKYININIKRESEEYSIQLSSGFEKFVANIALKLGIRSISKIPKNNFIIIDEGFGNFDDEKLNSTVSKLFDHFRSNFDYSIIISHIDTLKDYIDKFIEIHRVNLSDPNDNELLCNIINKHSLVNFR
jgi:DNA repair exonuclease SbcCD ATPase subunit